LLLCWHIIGYSLNDTIVVYDRIRDMLKWQAPMTMAALINLAINRTLSRTVLISLASLLAHVSLYCFGGPDMRNFASVLLMGIDRYVFFHFHCRAASALARHAVGQL